MICARIPIHNGPMCAICVQVLNVCSALPASESRAMALCIMSLRAVQSLNALETDGLVPAPALALRLPGARSRA